MDLELTNEKRNILKIKTEDEIYLYAFNDFKNMAYKEIKEINKEIQEIDKEFHYYLSLKTIVDTSKSSKEITSYEDFNSHSKYLDLKIKKIENNKKCLKDKIHSLNISIKVCDDFINKYSNKNLL